jgi:hypothetical protein
MPLEIIDNYGLPIAGVVGLAIALYKTVEFIQVQLLQQIEERHEAEMEAIRQLEEEHKVFHDIVIKLISNAKDNQMKLQEVSSKIDMLVKLINK